MAKKIHWIKERKQLELLASPLRHAIIDRLTAQGPLAVGDIAMALGCRQTAVYRHLHLLQKGGLVTSKSKGGSGKGRPVQLYRAVAEHIRFARAPRDQRNWSTMTRICRTVAKQAAKDYSSGFRTPECRIEGASRNQWFFRLFAAPSRARLARINALLDELVELVWAPDPNPGDPISVAWFMSPMESRAQRRKPR